MSGAPLYKAPEPPPKKNIVVIGGTLQGRQILKEMLLDKTIEIHVIEKHLRDLPKPPQPRLVR